MAMMLKDGPTIAPPKARQNELTAVIGAEKFDQLPGGVTNEKDKQRWADFRAAYHRAALLEEWAPFPLQLDVELGASCNFRCSCCLHGHRRREKNRLGLDTFKRVMAEAEEHGLVSVKFNYANEPLMVPGLPVYIEVARRRGVLNTFFATNGSLLNERAANALIDVGLTKVMISLDAATPETFKKMRNSDRFDQVVRNIERLLDIRARRGATHPLVRVNFLKTNQNIHELEAFTDRWVGVADMVGFQDLNWYPGKTDERSVDEHHKFRCSFPFKLMVVESSGNLLPCCTFSGMEMPLGHVSTHTVKRAWDSPQMRRLKALHHEGKWRSNLVCAKCVR